ncbi:hypothetical protein LSCM1_06296 [Leishmania martiniquensis]|uniref:Uncharacterized protein n=1 Tax=Leishmania martiniquensis TaxID=1580590 RepID=A0A836KPE4_9TRYP|nr:hypothetical protein LSCM1_06296 [Leishmania martiniquensis]
MTALITKQRYNWMGYDGTETEEVDTALLRAADVPGNNYSYLHRQRVILLLRESLLKIKRDLGLAPEDHSEQEARQRRLEQKRREEEERMRREAALADAERQRLEQEAAEEEARRQREAMERKEELRARTPSIDINSEDSDLSDEYSAVLLCRTCTQQEMDMAIEGFVKGTRSLLACTGNGYASYLDGSLHPTTSKLIEHNASKLDDVVSAMAGTYFEMPVAEEHSLEEVCAARDECDMARKKLEALRALDDRTYSVRIRTTEKNANGQPKQQLEPEDDNMTILETNFESAKQRSENVRKSYNKKASASGNAIAAALCMRAFSDAPEAAVAASALGSRAQMEQAAA